VEHNLKNAIEVGLSEFDDHDNTQTAWWRNKWKVNVSGQLSAFVYLEHYLNKHDEEKLESVTSAEYPRLALVRKHALYF
jgi:hypothetical protein